MSAALFYDRVKETSTTTGTGNFTLDGTVSGGFRTFSSVLSTNDTAYYCIENQNNNEWEVGLGTLINSVTWGRTTVLASSNGGSLVTFSSGTKNIFITAAANWIAGTTTATANTIPKSGSSGTIDKAWLPPFVASGASHAIGAVTDPGATAGTSRYLREDATFAVAPGVYNGLINGNFDFWQRGTSFSSVADATYTADRWTWGKPSGSSTQTISQSTDVPTIAQSGVFSNYSLKIAQTGTSTLNPGNLYYLYQIVEGCYWAPLAQQIMTLSFWVKSSLTGTYCINIDAGTDSNWYIAEYTISLANTWEYKTITIPASPSSGSWNYTPGTKGIFVNFALAAGSNYQGSAGSWQSTTFKMTTSNQVNWATGTSNTFFISQVQLQPGSYASAYAPRSYTDEYNMCLRYYEIHGGVANQVPQLLGTVGGLNYYISQTVSFAVRKAITPIVAKNGTWAVASATQPIADIPNVMGYRLYIQNTANNPATISANPDSADDTITAEANP